MSEGKPYGVHITWEGQGEDFVSWWATPAERQEHALDALGRFGTVTYLGDGAMFHAGDRVFYRVYPSGTPDTKTVGTVKRVERDNDGLPIYYVLWDDVAEGNEPTEYEAQDLARADGS